MNLFRSNSFLAERREDDAEMSIVRYDTHRIIHRRLRTLCEMSHIEWHRSVVYTGFVATHCYRKQKRNVRCVSSARELSLSHLLF